MSVREAAERLRKIKCGESVVAVYGDGRKLLPSLDSDTIDLRNAYLAEHQADECEPIDEAWLRWIGFVDGNMPGDLVLSPVVRGIATRGGEYWVVRSYPLPCVPKTRGQLRKLLEALGISGK